MLVRWQYFQNPYGPVIIFLHGFKGFFAWGHWQLTLQSFVLDAAAVVSYNISHGGTTPENATEFVDLEAFGHNTIGKELHDLKLVLDWVETELCPNLEDPNRPIVLLGHSRGGGVALLGAARFEAVSAVVTWNGVSDFGQRFAPDWIAAWERGETVWVPNSRTGQDMPLHPDAWLEYSATPEQFDIGAALQTFCNQSHYNRVLVVQGLADETVPPAEGRYLASLHPNVTLAEIPEGNHTFDGLHPWPDDRLLPPAAAEALAATQRFFSSMAKLHQD